MLIASTLHVKLEHLTLDHPTQCIVPHKCLCSRTHPHPHPRTTTHSFLSACILDRARTWQLCMPGLSAAERERWRTGEEMRGRGGKKGGRKDTWEMRGGGAAGGADGNADV